MKDLDNSLAKQLGNSKPKSLQDILDWCIGNNVLFPEELWSNNHLQFNGFKFEDGSYVSFHGDEDWTIIGWADNIILRTAR